MGSLKTLITYVVRLLVLFDNFITSHLAEFYYSHSLDFQLLFLGVLSVRYYL